MNEAALMLTCLPNFKRRWQAPEINLQPNVVTEDRERVRCVTDVVH